MSAPRDPSEQPLDWQDLHAAIRRRIAYALRGWSAEEVEDATQDAVFKVLRFLERSGPPDNMEGLLTVIARRTAVEHIRIRSRRRALDAVSEDPAVTLDEAARHELDEQVAWRAFQVIEFFRTHKAPCLELAEARTRGVDFGRLAENTGQSHRMLLQRWSRCMRRLRAAIAEGKIPWDGPERHT